MDVRRAKTLDPDDWLENTPDFSRPIATRLRDWIFHTAPDLTESIKWNCLCFSGRKLVCGLSACKKHVGVVFFRGTELSDPKGIFHAGEGNTNIRNVRITSPGAINLPALSTLLHAAVELDLRADVPPAPKVKRAPWPTPDFFKKALKAEPAASAFYTSLAPTYQREYLVWLTTAKRDETRDRRLAQTLRALAAGRKWIDRKRA